MKSPGSQSPWLYGGDTSYLANAYWNRASFSMRSLNTHVWPSTADRRGTAKSNVALGVVRPPAWMIGRYSSSAPYRKKTFWLCAS